MSADSRGNDPAHFAPNHGGLRSTKRPDSPSRRSARFAPSTVGAFRSVRHARHDTPHRPISRKTCRRRLLGSLRERLLLSCRRGREPSRRYPRPCDTSRKTSPPSSTARSRIVVLSPSTTASSRSYTTSRSRSARTEWSGRNLDERRSVHPCRGVASATRMSCARALLHSESGRVSRPVRLPRR